jgi:hypothetical protein
VVNTAELLYDQELTMVSADKDVTKMLAEVLDADRLTHDFELHVRYFW